MQLIRQHGEPSPRRSRGRRNPNRTRAAIGSRSYLRELRLGGCFKYLQGGYMEEKEVVGVEAERVNDDR